MYRVGDVTGTYWPLVIERSTIHLIWKRFLDVSDLAHKYGQKYLDEPNVPLRRKTVAGLVWNDSSLPPEQHDALQLYGGVPNESIPLL